MRKRKDVPLPDDGLPDTRFMLALLVGLLLLLTILCVTIIPRPTKSVPEEVLHDAQAVGVNLPSGFGFTDVNTVLLDEIANVRAQGFALSPVVYDISDPLSWLGRTVECPPAGCGGRILLLKRWYLSEGQARFVIAYELGRLVAREAGLPYDTVADNTTNSDRSMLFAVCFGTEKAREYARTFYKPIGDCEALRKLLTGTNTATAH